ncbi:MAG: permease prefix domain 2-containing transporter [Vicinamibacterales bacterium]
MNTAMPPRWADVVLRMLLAPQDRETVSGDLLEDYRDSIHPGRGRRRADLWYVSQVAGFAWRANRTWAGLLGVAFVARTALDWLLPTADFHARSTVSTTVSAGIYGWAGFVAAWRTHSLRVGALAGIVTALFGAIISIAGAAVLLAIWHDAPTFAAIDGSGGLGEVFTLPVLLVVPGALLGALGGLIGGASRRLASHAQ